MKISKELQNELKKHLSRIGKIGGSKTSESKTRAARENAKRPRKKL